jgi:hypothetical protein
LLLGSFVDSEMSVRPKFLGRIATFLPEIRTISRMTVIIP